MCFSKPRSDAWNGLGSGGDRGGGVGQHAQACCSPRHGPRLAEHVDRSAAMVVVFRRQCTIVSLPWLVHSRARCCKLVCKRSGLLMVAGRRSGARVSALPGRGGSAVSAASLCRAHMTKTFEHGYALAGELPQCCGTALASAAQGRESTRDRAATFGTVDHRGHSDGGLPGARALLGCIWRPVRRPVWSYSLEVATAVDSSSCQIRIKAVIIDCVVNSQIGADLRSTPQPDRNVVRGTVVAQFGHSRACLAVKSGYGCARVSRPAYEPSATR